MVASWMPASITFAQVSRFAISIQCFCNQKNGPGFSLPYPLFPPSRKTHAPTHNPISLGRQATRDMGMKPGSSKMPMSGPLQMSAVRFPAPLISMLASPKCLLANFSMGIPMEYPQSSGCRYSACCKTSLTRTLIRTQNPEPNLHLVLAKACSWPLCG